MKFYEWVHQQFLKNASLEKHGQKRNFMVIFEIFFSVCCCFDCIVICVTNLVNTSGLGIADKVFKRITYTTTTPVTSAWHKSKREWTRKCYFDFDAVWHLSTTFTSVVTKTSSLFILSNLFYTCKGRKILTWMKLSSIVWNIWLTICKHVKPYTLPKYIK